MPEKKVPAEKTTEATNKKGVVEKKWFTTFLFSLFLGGIGVDRFYLGKTGTGILKLITFGGLGLWYLIDLILIATRNMSGVKWVDDGKNDKRNALIVFGVVFVLGALISATSPKTKTEMTASNTPEATQQASASTEPVAKEQSPKEKLFDGIKKLMDSKQAFDTGSYVKGEIPVGDYAFVAFDGGGKYYSEEDSAGNIVDNENFDSFGYVYVHSVGNLETRGVLINVNAFGTLGVKGAKEIYEKLNSADGYKGSAWYKVGTDIEPGQYTIESLGQAYVAVMTGPVGNSDIVDNNNFNGKYSVSVNAGQYLKISRGEIK